MNVCLYLLRLLKPEPMPAHALAAVLSDCGLGELNAYQYLNTLKFRRFIERTPLGEWKITDLGIKFLQSEERMR